VKSTPLSVVLLLAALCTPAFAQPTMDELWPNPNGMRWEYEYELIYNPLFDYSIPGYTSPAYMHLLGTASTPGGPAQVLIAEHEPPPGVLKTTVSELPPLLRKIWHARPDLRDGLVARYAAQRPPEYWNPMLLHGGYFMKNPTEIEMWQDMWDHSTWLYLTDDLTIGASFVMQLVPELAEDIYLHGTVADLDATVETPAGTFSGAVRMDYLVDLGVAYLTDENGTQIGLAQSELVGHVHYVPDVGPVDLLEEFTPYVWLDCGEDDCPPEYLILVGEVAVTDILALAETPSLASVGDVVPGVARLEQNYPNPFNPRTTISFSLSSSQWARVGVYTPSGRRITILAERTFPTGDHTLDWDGRDATGQAVPSGTYLVRLETQSRVETLKVSLIR